jgi:hypothetical protein
MTEAFGELATIVFGRYFFGTVGAAIRYCWLRLRGKKVTYAQLWEDPKNSKEAYDKQAFKSRLVGFGVILAFIILAAS